MDTYLFKTFIAVAKNESVTKASEEVYLTQPAVTKQIKALERMYGIKLFERKNKKFVLTDKGAILLDYAYRIVNLYDESINIVNEIGGELRGTLKVAANLTLGIYVLPESIKGFRDVHPNLKIELFLDNTENIGRAVKRNDSNFGFVGVRLHDALITHHPFYQDQIVLVMNPNMGPRKKTLSWKELQSIPYISRERGSDIRETCEQWLKRKNLSLEAQMELNNTEAIKKCVQAGIGFSLLPWCTVRQEVKTGLLRVASIPYFNVTQDFYICHCKGKRFTKPERTFLEYLFTQIESNATASTPAEG